jgi:membrane protein
MPKSIGSFWTLGGLTLPELLRRTARACWHDEVFGQGGRMAFYHFLAMFPALLLLFTLTAHIPHFSDHVKVALQDLCHQVLPDQVADLFRSIMRELSAHPRSGLSLVSVSLAAIWAAHNGTWAMVYGLNRAYEVQENRSRKQITVTIVGLTCFLAMVGAIALFLIFCSAYVQTRFHAGVLAMRTLEWLVLIVALSIAFAALYRFAPNLGDHQWCWSTPGAACALILWIAATLVARLYFDHVNNYSRTYGQLNGVAMLLLWLYLTNGAILIGGEMNSEIKKAAAERERAAQPAAFR